MSFEVPVSYVEQFSTNVHMLAEQSMSRLRNTVMTEDVTGESFSLERIGSVDAEIVADLHGDTPLVNTPHSRRWGFIKTYDVADLLDKESQVKLLIDPMSRYTMRHSGAMGREFDKEILRALGGSVAQGKNGETQVALPSAQKFTASGTSDVITVNDLIRAQEILNQNETDDMGMMPRFCVMSAAGFRQLLQINEIRSSDFNVVKALSTGRVDNFMGFTFIRTELIPDAQTSASKAYFYDMMAIKLGIGANPTSAVDMRPDKRRAQQVYTWGAWGAFRTEDVRVVEMTFDGTPGAPV